MPASLRARQSREQADPVAVTLEVLPRLVRLMQQATAAAPGAQLTLTQYRLLKWLDQGCRQTVQLARRLDVTPATVSASVDGLAQRGLVERLPHGPDRRVVPLRPTAAGRRALEAARERQREAVAAVLRRLAGVDAAALARGLAAVRVALDAAEEEVGHAGGR